MFSFIEVLISFLFFKFSIDDRLELKRRLHCKPFKWFLDNVYPELTIPQSVSTLFGSVRQRHMCLDTLGHSADSTVGLYLCHDTGGNQEWTLEDNTYIKHHDMCLTIPNTVPGTLVLMQPCEDGDNQVSKFLFIFLEIAHSSFLY